MMSSIRQIIDSLRTRTGTQAVAASPMHLPSPLYPDDVFLVGYPKSGTTWLAFLLGNYMTDNRCDWVNSPKIIPDIHFNPQDCASVARPRLIRSHMPFVSQYPRVVYLTRDGRDVAVSYFYYLQRFNRIARDAKFDEYIERFNAGLLDQFGPWGQHVNHWLDQKKDDLLLVRYEDMKKNAAHQLTRVLDFAGIAVDQARLASAVAASSFEKMRELEEKQNDQIEKIATIPFDKSIPFARSGKVGGWRTHFSPASLEQFIKVHGSAMMRLGYDTTASLTASTEARRVA